MQSITDLNYTEFSPLFHNSSILFRYIYYRIVEIIVVNYNRKESGILKNKFKLLIGSLLVVVLLTIGLTTAVFADPQDEDGNFGPGYYCLRGGNEYAGGTSYSGWSCH